MHDKFHSTAFKVLGEGSAQGVITDLPHKPRCSPLFGIQSRHIGRATTPYPCGPHPVVEPPAGHAGQHNEDVLQKISNANKHLANLVHASSSGAGLALGCPQRADGCEENTVSCGQAVLPGVQPLFAFFTRN